MLIPYLYIGDHSASDPVILSGAISTAFVWDAKHRCHVKRFASLEDYKAKAPEILKNEPIWEIFTGVEVVEDAGVQATDHGENVSRIDLLERTVLACQSLASGGATRAGLDEDLRDLPAVVAVAAFTSRWSVMERLLDQYRPIIDARLAANPALHQEFTGPATIQRGGEIVDGAESLEFGPRAPVGRDESQPVAIKPILNRDGHGTLKGFGYQITVDGVPCRAGMSLDLGGAAAAKTLVECFFAPDERIRVGEEMMLDPEDDGEQAAPDPEPAESPDAFPSFTEKINSREPIGDHTRLITPGNARPSPTRRRKRSGL